MKNLNRILEAPCCFCGYNGKGYFQAETHKEECPFYSIGGLYERIDFLVKCAKEKRLKIIFGVHDVDEYYKE